MKTETSQAQLAGSNRIVSGMTITDYLRDAAYNKHDLDDIRSCPAMHHDKCMGRVPDYLTKALDFGAALHSMILDQECIYVVPPDTYTSANGEEKAWTMASKTCKAWKSGQDGKMILSRAEANMIDAALSLTCTDARCRRLLTNGCAELSMFARDDCGVMIKSRPDWRSGGIFVDLKTTTDASTAAFSKEIFNRRYHVQAAMVRRVARLLKIDFAGYYYIAIEKSTPLRLNVRQLSPCAMDLGNEEIDQDLETLKECLDSDEWPDYSGRGESIAEITVPTWAWHIGGDQELNIGGKSYAL